MKSSYKLFGIFWDHKAGVDFRECVVSPFKYGIDYRHPYCLFDLVGEYRNIRISEMLSVDSEEEWQCVCNQLRGYNHVALIIDYITDVSSAVASLFYIRKVCQIYHSLQITFPDACIVIQVPPDNSDAWNELQAMVA
ncbi:MAG: hypothetical protein K6F79_06205 [Saccharofermentans sp.]|nr:hypothetical protein [Saccharofermentans sp.]